MEKEKKNKTPVPVKEKWFMAVNLFLIVAILSFYLGRLIYYKKYFDSLQTNLKSDLLITVLANKMKAVEITDLSYDEKTETYSFQPNASNNYLEYGGICYRILDVNENGLIRIVSEEVQSVFVVYQKLPFAENELNLWLNPADDSENSGIYFRSLYNPTSLLAQGTRSSLVNTVDDIGKHVENQDDGYVGLLTLEDYQQFGGASSFLNTGEQFLLATCDEEGNYWMVNSDGSVFINKNPFMLCGIRPVVNLNFEIKAISGEGTEEDPYVITQDPEEPAEMPIGSYVQLCNKLFTVIENGENCRLMLAEDAGPVTFGKTNSFVLKTGVGKYLNTDFLKQLEGYEDYLVKADQYVGAFSVIDTFSYLETYSQKLNCYVGLPKLGDLGLQDLKNVYLANPTTSNEHIIYSLDENGVIYGDFVDVEKYVRPVVTLRKDLSILSGSGKEADPYILEVATHE